MYIYTHIVTRIYIYIHICYKNIYIYIHILFSKPEVSPPTCWCRPPECDHFDGAANGSLQGYDLQHPSFEVQLWGSRDGGGSSQTQKLDQIE